MLSYYPSPIIVIVLCLFTSVIIIKKTQRLSRRSAVQAKMALQDGFLHGDLHPGNLFIQLQGRLVMAWAWAWIVA